MQWRDLIRGLEREVNWYDPSYLDRQAPAVESILHEAYQSPEVLAERTEEIAHTPELFKKLAAHMGYPQALMDKFVLHMDEHDRFRIRMHRFWPREVAGNAIEQVHYHKWDMSTIMMTGNYEERRFEVVGCDERRGTARVKQTGSNVLAPGQVNSLPVGVPHQIINHSEDQPCITLFVRGPSRKGMHTRIFDTDTGTFFDNASPIPLLRNGLLEVGKLNGAFFPVPPARG